jgi:hypothetical protein
MLKIETTLALHRVYLLVVAGFTAWVGCFGFFWPQEIERALAWPVPPLHARFIGALYLSATAFLVLGLFARSRLALRSLLDIALVWTGWLLMVSLLHWDQFDPARVQVWFWAVAYLVFPLAAGWLGRAGAALVLLALSMFALPAWAATWWPWKLPSFLAQLYSGPLLGYGVGCLLLAARRNWLETLLPALGLALFALLALLGSSWHLALFTPGSASKSLWFAGLGLLALSALWLALTSARHVFAGERA